MGIGDVKKKFSDDKRTSQTFVQLRDPYACIRTMQIDKQTLIIRNNQQYHNNTYLHVYDCIVDIYVWTHGYCKMRIMLSSISMEEKSVM